jgi:hypothetical protein
MARRKQGAGITGVSIPVSVKDTSSTTGAGLSLAFNTAGLVAEFRRQGSATWTAITLVAGTLGTWSSGGFSADTGITGDYELSIPDAAFVAGAKWVIIRLRGAANMLPVRIEYELDLLNYQDGVRAGLTALPAVNTPGAGALLTSGTGTGQLNVIGGIADANVRQNNGAATTTADGTAQAGSAAGSFTLTLALADAAGANAYTDRILTIVGGSGVGQSRLISAYNSSTKVVTVARAWDVAVDVTSLYAIDGSNYVADTYGIGALLLALATFQSTINDGSSTTTVIDTALVGTADLTGNKVVFTTGALKGVTRTITSMNTGTGQITLLTALPSAPVNGSAFSVIQGSKALEQFLSVLGTDSRPKVSGDVHSGGVTVAGVTANVTLAATPPTAAQIAASILTTPANLLQTDSNGRTTLTPAEHALFAGDLFAGSFLTIPAANTQNMTTSAAGAAALVMTFKQWQALLDATADKVYSGAPVASGSITLTYYVHGSVHTASTILRISTISFDANKNQTTTLDKIANPFPAIN